MDIRDFTPEQIEKAKACKTPEELAALAETEGIELADGQLEAMSGGMSVTEWTNQNSEEDSDS